MNRSKVQILLHSMSRQTNLKGIRLGISSWWKIRTPPTKKKGLTHNIIESLICGVLSKFKYILSDIVLQRNFNNKGIIYIFATPKSRLNIKKNNNFEHKNIKNTIIKKKRLIVYLINYLRLIINTYYGVNYKFSFRHVYNYLHSSPIINTYLTKNNLPIMTMLRKTFRKFQSN